MSSWLLDSYQSHTTHKKVKDICQYLDLNTQVKAKFTKLHKTSRNFQNITICVVYIYLVHCISRWLYTCLTLNVVYFTTLHPEYWSTQWRVYHYDIYSRMKRILKLIRIIIACDGAVHVIIGVKIVQLVESAGEGRDHEEEDDEELPDVQDHTSQGDLERA